MKNSKRKILLASIICSIVAMQGMVASADINADINGDGKVSAMDILLVKKNVLNIIPQSSFKFDINNDGFVNVLDLNLVKNNSFITTEPPKTDPPQTEAPVTEPPQTEFTEDPVLTKTDGKGNVYPDGGYSQIGDIVFKTGADGYEDAQNYAAAIEEYHGIPMVVSGNAVSPACYDNFDTTGTLEELNAWRAGRSPTEIGPAEISNNWSLIANDIDFFCECMNYLDSLGLNRDFLVFD